MIGGGSCWTAVREQRSQTACGRLTQYQRERHSLSTDKPGRLSAMVCFGDRHPAPERTGIGSIPMKLHHPIEEFAHASRLLVEAEEVPEVAARFFDDPRVVVVLRPFV